MKVLDFLDLKIGDKVEICCYSGLGTGGISKVTNIIEKYNKKTNKIDIIIYFGKHKFNALDGKAINSPYAYYLRKIKES